MKYRDDECDVCGSKLDEEDKAIHLCKVCQGITIK